MTRNINSLTPTRVNLSLSQKVFEGRSQVLPESRRGKVGKSGIFTRGRPKCKILDFLTTNSGTIGISS